jgi:hypothetical protein
VARNDIQTNFRLPPEKIEVLEAAAYVERAGSVQKLVRQLVEDAVQYYAQLPAVNKALEAQKEQLSAREGKVAPLSRNPRKVDQGSRRGSGSGG